MKKLFILFAVSLIMSAEATCAPRGGEPPGFNATNVFATDMICTLSVAGYSAATSVSESFGAKKGSRFSAGVFTPSLKMNLTHHTAKNENPVVKKFKPSVKMEKRNRPPQLTKQAG